MELAHLAIILVIYIIAMAGLGSTFGASEATPIIRMLFGPVMLLLFTLHWVSTRKMHVVALEGWLLALLVSILLSMLLPFTTTYRVPLDTYLLVFLVPLSEELYFRGILMDHLLVNASRSAAVMLTTVLFALLHLPLGTFIPMLFLGLVLALVTVKTKKVAWAILLHAAWNFAVVWHAN